MARYVIKRLLIMIPLLLAVGIIMYTLMEFVPGDPVDLALGTGFHSEEERELKREAMGLDRPFVVRLGEYMKNIILHFDFGKSLIDGTDVRSALLNRFPNTFYIAILSIILTVVVGLPLGIYTAVHANSLGDKASLFITLLFDCMPNFWTALLLVLLFSVTLGWLPPSGNSSFKYFILPTLANSLGGLAGFTRQVRASMLGGATIVEVIFSIPGIGQYLVNAINKQDYTAATGSIIFIALTFSVIMLLTDLLYAYADPRIKAQYAGSNRKKVAANG